MKSVIAVFIGGGLGSAARFLLSAIVQRHIPGFFPYGTLAVNVLGSLLLGIVLGLASRSLLPAEWRLFLAVGFCGGFTTFSTFSLEVADMLRGEQYTTAFLYIAVSIVAGLAAVYTGLWLTRPTAG